MRKSADIKRDLQTALKAQGEIVAGTKDENGVSRSLTEDEQTRFDAEQTKIESLRAELQRAETHEENQRQLAEDNATPVDPSLGTEEQEEKRSIQERFDIKRMLNNLVARSSMDGAEREVNDIAVEELRASRVPEENISGFNIPASMAFRSAKGITRADGQTVTQDGGDYGGTLVGEDGGHLLPNFIDRLSIEDLGIRPMYDLVGNYPLHNVADFEFQNVGEVEELTAQKAQTGKKVLKPKRTGMMVYISNQLLAQSSANIMQVLGRRTNEALNRRLMHDLINGDGNDPNTLGILNDTIAFDFAGAAGTLDLAKVLELMAEVDEERECTQGANLSKDPL